MGFIEQDSIKTAISGIRHFHHYLQKTGTAREHIGIDAGDTIADSDIRQASAARESSRLDVGNTVGDDDVGQTGAARERKTPNTGNTIRDDNAGHAGATRERAKSDTGDPITDGNLGQDIAVAERITLDAGNGGWDGVVPCFSGWEFDKYCLVLIEQDPIKTAISRIHRIHRYLQRASTFIECIVPDTGDAAGDNDTGQAGAVTERIVLYAGNTVGDSVEPCFCWWT